LQLAAIAAGTVVIKQIIDTSEDVLGALKQRFTPIWAKKWEPHWEMFMGIIPQLKLWKKETAPLEILPDWQEWIFAFFIACMLVFFGGQIIGLFGDAFKLTNLMLGVLA